MTAQSPLDAKALAGCGSEQLHLSGRIQAHGALVAADIRDRRITYASANTAEVIGSAPQALFESPVTSIFSSADQDRLEEAIEAAGRRLSSLDLYGMGLSAARNAPDASDAPDAPDATVDVRLQKVDGHIVIEVERAHGDGQVPLSPVLNASQAMGEATTVSEVEAAVVRAVRELTGFDRTMVYRFHDDEHGEVVAEDRLPRLRPYLGHHFPQSDIPLQARQIYLRTPSRYIPDVDEGEVSVLGSPRMAGAVLDLGQVSLRSVSPYHLEYMRNMDTAASISFAMAEGGRLTRLVSCISEKPRSLSPAKRRSCELLVLQAKLQVVAAEERARLKDTLNRESIRVRLRSAMQNAVHIAEGLTSASGAELLELCQADGAAVRVDGHYGSIGAAPSEQAVRTFASEIRAELSPGVPWATDRLRRPVADSLGAAGCLFVQLATSDDFVVWFRQDLPQQLMWLGDPSEHFDGVINPRKSFRTWLQQVSGSSSPWTDANVEAAQLVAYDVEAAQLSRAQARLAYLGLHDALTGLPNRHYLISAMTMMLQAVTPTDPVAAIFIDLNHFKPVNDRYGHDAGDSVLRECARRIVEVTRTGSDLVGRADAWDPSAGRIGGDEFVVALPHTDAAGGTLVADRIRQSLLEPIDIGPGLSVTISAAIGVAVADAPEEPEHLLRRADAAMYEDKRQTRGSPG